jgi:hypothetical protein
MVSLPAMKMLYIDDAEIRPGVCNSEILLN